MNEMSSNTRIEYYRDAESWSADRVRASASARKIAWLVAGVASCVALFEAIALIMLLPLKTVVPYTLLVDKQTGFVQELKPLEGQVVTPDQALIKSFLAQYVLAREGFDIDSLQESYRKVALWSGGDARKSYIAGMQASNPLSPLATLPRRASLQVEVRSISLLNTGTAMIRYAVMRSDPGGQRQEAQNWVSIVKYRFSGETMSEADRLVNPLGFQVMRYRRDAETLPAGSAPAAVAAPMPTARGVVP
ncbi:VirB8/TrbF family protein [Novosphingobium sp.]|uniref:virB8 family protein n=1 Tax=Novosphingobium sp. TaxID=1874826 RepID=UPI002611A188|nr:VirB8/TrbF family protein [Novosphingobium sp.]